MARPEGTRRAVSRVEPLSRSSKTDGAVEQLARLFISWPSRSRIPTGTELQTTLGAGSSTVQRAVAMLEETGAVSLQARPRLGSYVTGRDLGVLWRMAGNPSVAFSLAIPNSREYQGLAAGLRAEFERLGIPVSPMYAQGSRIRTEALLEGRIDLAILSAGAAEETCRTHPELVVAAQLGPGTYYARDSVVVISRSAEPPHPGSRVGIDESSWDHRELTRTEFRDGTFTPESYLFLPQSILNGTIDFAVWHRTAMGLSVDQQNLHIRAPAREETGQLAARLSAAAIVARTADEQTLGVVAELDLQAITETQRGVVDHHVVPVF